MTADTQVAQLATLRTTSHSFIQQLFKGTAQRTFVTWQGHSSKGRLPIKGHNIDLITGGTHHLKCLRYSALRDIWVVLSAQRCKLWRVYEAFFFQVVRFEKCVSLLPPRIRQDA